MLFHSIQFEAREFDCAKFGHFNIRLKPLLKSSKNIMILKAKNWKTFEIIENNEVKGTLTYKSMFKASADIQTVKDGEHSLKWFFGFLVAKFKITQNDRETVKLKMDWKGHFFITLENGIEYKFVSKGFFKRRIFLENQESKELIEISQKYNWKRWNYDYEIEDREAPQIDLLSLIAVYALNYQQQYQMGLMMLIIMTCNAFVNLVNL